MGEEVGRCGLVVWCLCLALQAVQACHTTHNTSSLSHIILLLTDFPFFLPTHLTATGLPLASPPSFPSFNYIPLSASSSSTHPAQLDKPAQPMARSSQLAAAAAPATAAAHPPAGRKRKREKAGVWELLRRISWLHWAGIVGLVSVILGGRHFFR